MMLPGVMPAASIAECVARSGAAFVGGRRDFDYSG
jgi:hypothetical protein